jgi:hypothetical protein
MTNSITRHLNKPMKEVSHSKFCHLKFFFLPLPTVNIFFHFFNAILIKSFGLFFEVFFFSLKLPFAFIRAFIPVGDSHRSLAIQRRRQQQQQQQQGIVLHGRWHFGSRNDSVHKGIAGHSGDDDHPQQDGDRPLHEILGGDSATTRFQTAPPPAPAATRQQIGTGQRAGHNEGTNNNISHPFDRDPAATTTTTTTAAADAIQWDPAPPPPQFQSSPTCQILILWSLVETLIHK